MFQQSLPWLQQLVDVSRVSDAGPYLLASAGVLGLIAIAGGGSLSISNFSVGGLGPISRALAGVAASVLAALWLFVPQFQMTVAGQLVPGPGAPFETKPVQVGLQPVPDDIVMTVVDDDLRFTFPTSDQLRVGIYNLVMYGEHGERLGSTLVAIQEGEDLIVTKLGDQAYRQDSAADAQATVAKARKRYADLKWEQKLQGLHVLIELARVQPSIKEELQSQMDSDDPVMRDMAAFALAPLNCDQRAIAYLRTEVVDNDPNEYRKLRAASVLVCDGNQREPAMDLLRARMADSYSPGVRRAAAYYLAKLGSRTKCVAQSLIGGLENKADFVVNLSRAALVELTNRDFKNDIGLWNAWYENTDELTPCFWLDGPEKLSEE